MQPTRTESRSPYWGVPIARAIPAFVIAAIATFNPNHSSQVGLLLFGSYAVVSGVLVAALSPRSVAERVNRRLFVVSGVIGVLLGVGALVFNGGGFPLFLFIVSLFGALTGFIELYCGLRTRGATARAGSTGAADRAPAKDWLAVGAFTALLALVFLVIPLDVVTAVGLLGGYAVVVGIFLVIGGLSLRSPVSSASPSPSASASPSGSPAPLATPTPAAPRSSNPQTPETTL